MDRVRAAAATLRAVLAGLEPGRFSPEAAAEIAEELAATENACGTAKVRHGWPGGGGGCAPRSRARGRVRLAGECDRVDGARTHGASSEAVAAVEACPGHP